MPSPRVQTAINVTTVLTALGLLVSLISGAIAFGRRDGKVTELENNKLDHAVFQQSQTTLEKRLGEMQNDISVIRTAVCITTPKACTQPASRTQ